MVTTSISAPKSEENENQATAALRKKCPYSSYSGPYFPSFGLNTERYSGYEKTLLTLGKIPIVRHFFSTFYC